MASINPKDVVIRKQVQSVQFGFYTDDDVRKRSILEITSSQAFDPMGHALPGGLYDPRLGTTDRTVPCTTCALPHADCPGHFAHIELAVPVYHPILFMDIVQFLRYKCVNCHKFQAPPRLLAIHRAKFHLLYQHETQRLLELDEELAQAAHSAMDASESLTQKKSVHRVAAGKAMDQVLRSLQPSSSPSSSEESVDRVATSLNSYEMQLRKELIQACVQDCKRAKRCEHCGCYNPKIRQDSANKIFQVELSKQYKKRNAQDGIKLVSALTKKKDNNYDSDDSAHERRARDLTEGSDVEEDDEEDSEEGDSEVDDNDEDRPTTSKQDKFMHPAEIEAQLARTWKIDPFLCNCLFGGGPSTDVNGYKIFFLRAVPVPPSRFRPAMHLNGMSVEHSQTQYLSKMISLNDLLRTQFASGDEDRAYSTWIELQTNVNCFMDSSKYPGAATANQIAPGIRQILERKEGLFRKNMMGKRVDYACRSVISPDPYVGTNEIGLPRYFATVLTYPTPVIDLNIKEMRQLVERGVEYPGARWVEISGKRVDLSKMKKHKREAIAAQLLTHIKKGGMPALVGRQLRDGDYVLMNRQPTLHKPGIMAHRVRLLHNPTQKTIRMHYANCNTYNADYDGDEMNCHFPQSDLARAEAQFIARTNLQYIVPTDGSPLRGLIQDHVVGGVIITKKDSFFEKWMYQQLIFAALASLPGLEVIRADMAIELLPPAIVKPRELWTGKQIISTLLLHLSKRDGRESNTVTDLPGLCMERKAKTPESAFGPGEDEHLVLIRNGELLRGVLDKNAFGATEFSLVHATYEAYGPEKAGLLLNSLGRLFTAYIQNYAGHSCRVEDLVLTKEADIERRALVQRAYNLGSRAAKAWADSEGGKVPIEEIKGTDGTSAQLKPVEAASASAKIGELLSGSEGKENFAALDSYMQGKLNPLASEIVKKCLPRGLAVQFPHNTFGVMTMTGAKGSIVNQSQVTCALGQQALEGRRVPRLSSGRTLPSFAPYDPNPRADGFVMDRFLTGVRPQEYYFHCMAGREGLVDTAVKTSRSGYLQRCLIKHLEELKICYDYTVRNSEGEVVQFLYGEDGLDPTLAPYLDCSTNSFEYMARNHDSLKRKNIGLPGSSLATAADDAVMLARLEDESTRVIKLGDSVLARRLRLGDVWKRGSLCQGWHRATVLKIDKRGKHVDLKYESDDCVTKRVPVEINLGRCGSSETSAESSVAVLVKLAASDPILLPTRGCRVGTDGACVSERVASAAYKAMDSKNVISALKQCNLSKDDLSSLVAAKYGSSLCAPGEAVGSIAAQSVGEPSTQMTLNTFHLAGAGANVTLGIPRLREIIMTASREPKTPTLSVPLNADVSQGQALRLTRAFTRLTLMELIAGKKGVSVTECLQRGDAGEWMRNYYVTLKLYPAERIKEAFGLTLVDIAKVVAKKFTPVLSKNMKMEIRRAGENFEILGGEATDYIHQENKDDADEEARLTRGDTDELNDDEVDADEDMDLGDEEDGADREKYRRRAASVSYDDDGEASGNDNDGEDSAPLNVPLSGNDDASDTAPMTTENTGLLKVDKKSNSIPLAALQVEPEAPPLLMVDIVEKTAAKTLVRSKKGIDEAFVNEEDGRGLCLQTAGVNFEEIWKLDCVDHNRLVSNHIWAMRNAYGVEAARTSIVGQIKSVFGAYGIEVDPRHLSLIADYMTFDGGYKAMNRIGMEQSSSPFLRMSFETTCHFLKDAAMASECDDLSSPSANIVLGRPVKHGTGSFSLLTMPHA